MPGYPIKRILETQVNALHALALQTFSEAFAHRNNPEDFAIYVRSKLSETQILSELRNPESEFYFLYDEQLPIAYIKVNVGSAQNEKLHNAMELERIYVLQTHSGKGVGSILLQYVMILANERKVDFLWLGVWDQNMDAIRFYERHGFEVFGSHQFMLGNDEQTDLLMKIKVD